MDRIEIVVAQHPDGFVAYPLGVRGVVGQGETAAEALADVTSALHLHVETFGAGALDVESPVLDAILAEAPLAAR